MHVSQASQVLENGFQQLSVQNNSGLGPVPFKN